MARFEHNFKTLRDGRQAFYPYIFVRRGYVVSDEQRAILCRYLLAATVVGVLVVVIVNYFLLAIDASKYDGDRVGFASYLPIILIFALDLAAYHGGLRWLTRNMERAPADERPTLTQRLRTSARHSDWLVFLFVVMIAVLLMVSGLNMAGTRNSGDPPVGGMALAAVGAMLALMVGYMAWAKGTGNF